MTDERMALAELLQKSGDGNFLRSVAEAVLQILMEADVEGLIGAGRHERTGDRLNYRNAMDLWHCCRFRSGDFPGRLPNKGKFDQLGCPVLQVGCAPMMSRLNASRPPMRARHKARADVSRRALPRPSGGPPVRRHPGALATAN
jgi:hypothetical protein